MRAAAARRGRTRVLLATLAAVFLILPGPVSGQPDARTARLAEIARVLAKLQGTVHVHADGTSHVHAADALDSHDLAVLGLRQGSGPCLGMYEMVGSPDPHRCTHGPDPAPLRPNASGLGAGTASTAALDVPPPPAGWTVPSKIPCYTSGPYVEVLWIYEQGTTSRLPQFAEHVRRHVAGIDLLYNISAKAVIGTNGQPSIRHVKWAHDASCNLKITPRAVSSAAFPDIGSIENYLSSHGWLSSGSKYLAFLDMDGCGGGVADFMGDESSSQSNAANSGGTYGQVFGCLDLFAPYFDAGAIGAHELMHTLGAVNAGSPHSTDGHCWDDEPESLSGADIMCYDDGYPGPFVRPAACPITAPETFDCKKDDYFNPNPPTGNYLKTHWNSTANKFLSTVEPPSYKTIALATASVPGNGTSIGGQKTITASTTVPPGRTITKVEFKVGSTVIDTDYDAPYSIDLDTFQYTTLANVKVTATPYDDLDYPGVAGSATFTIANPQVHLDSPTELSYNSPLLTWSAKAAGFGGRTITKVQLTDGYGTPIGPADMSAPYGGTIDFSSEVYPGNISTITLGLEVTDSAGVERATEAREVYVGAPSVQLPYGSSAGSPSLIAVGSPLVAEVVGPPSPSIARVEMWVDGSKIGQDTSAPFSVPWAVPAGTTGAVVARAVDAKGFTIDSETEYVEVVDSGLGGAFTAPAPNATVATSSVNVVVDPTVAAGWNVYGIDVWDPIDYASTSLTQDGGDPNGTWSASLDVSSLGRGYHVLMATIYACDGTCSTFSQTYGTPLFINFTGGPTVAMTAPADGAKVKQTVNVSATVAGGGTIYSVAFYAGESWIGYDDTAPFTAPWDTSLGSDGTVRVTARAQTGLGTYSSPARFYSVRNLYAFMSAPTPGQTISGTFLLKGGGRCDRDCSLETATFFVDGVAVNYDRAAPYQFSLDTTAYADGAHTYAITITTNDYRAVSSAIYPMTINN